MGVEFDVSGTGSFRVSGMVLQTVMSHLRQKRFADAVQLYQSCAEVAGAQLLEDFDTNSEGLQEAHRAAVLRRKRLSLGCSCV